MNERQRQVRAARALRILPISGGETAFDPGGFQHDSFQIEPDVIPPWVTPVNISNGGVGNVASAGGQNVACQPSGGNISRVS